MPVVVYLFRSALILCLWGALPSWAQIETNIVRSFAIPSGGKLILRTDRGAVEVKSGQSDGVEVQVLRTVKREGADKLEQLLIGHEVTFHRKDNLLTVEARDTNSTTTTVITSRSSWWSKLFGRSPRTVVTQTRNSHLDVRFLVTLPPRFSVDIHTASGPIVVPDLDGEVRVETGSGYLQLGAIQGPVWAQSHGGNIQLVSAQGTVEATTSSGDINVGSVRGDAALQTFGGLIRVTNVTDQVEATTAAGDVEVGYAGSARIKSFGGNLTIKDTKGAIYAETGANGQVSLGTVGGNLTAISFGGRVAVQKVGGDAEVKTANGDVEIQEVGGDLAAQTSGGTVRVATVRGKVVARTTTGDVKLDWVAGAIEASTMSGGINAVLIRQPQTDCHLETGTGDIELSLTNSVAVDLRAKGIGGRVIVELPMTDVSSNERRAGAMRGKINGGGPTIDLRAEGGAVRVKKL